MNLDGFLVYLFHPDGREEHLALTVAEVLGVSRVRLWSRFAGAKQMPANVLPSMVLHHTKEAPMAEPLPDFPLPGGVDPAWQLRPVDHPRHPVIELRINDERGVLGQGFYALDDVFGPVVHYAAHSLYSHGSLGFPPAAYRYDVRGIQHQDQGLRPPESAGSFTLTGPMGDEALSFRELDGIGRQIETAPVLFKVRGVAAPGPIRMYHDAWESLADRLEMPLDRETGGYLVGQVGGDDSPETVSIHHALPAQSAASGAGHYLMSPDSASGILRRIDRLWPDLQVVGWYHSHVFRGTPDLAGLSATDVDEHKRSFQQPWAVAGLINVWRENGTVSRQIRLFRSNPAGELVASDFDVIAEEGK